jgi:TatD DNase family protein
MMLFDTHTHINDDAFADDLAECLRRAEAVGVGRMIVIGIDRPSMERVLSIIERYPSVYGAIGWNPEDAAKMTENDFKWIVAHLNHTKIVALGEIGLDYHWDASAKAVQHDIFRRQIRAAVAAGLPLIIHCRDAVEDTERILREEHADAVGGAMHCYTGNLDWAKKFIDLNFYISFGGILTFKNAQQVRRTAAGVPAERLLIETDCPYLSPQPFRGKRNEPARVRLVAEKLAEIRGLSVAAIEKMTTDNADRCFHIC